MGHRIFSPVLYQLSYLANAKENERKSPREPQSGRECGDNPAARQATMSPDIASPYPKHDGVHGKGRVRFTDQKNSEKLTPTRFSTLVCSPSL